MIAEYDGPIRFRILHHEHNRGLSVARNTGTDAATGDYILFIDSDDIISNDCVEKLMAPVLEDESVEMVVGEHMRFSDEGMLPRPQSWRHKEKLSTHEAVRNLYFDRERHLPPAAWNKLTSRAFINQHQLRFKEEQIFEDTLWTFFEMKHLSHVYIIPDVTYYYYYRTDSICFGTKKEELTRQWGAVFEEISQNFTSGDESREAALHLGQFIKSYLRQPKTKELRATARRFSKALPFRKYPVEKTLLWAAIILPHNHWGRQQYKHLAKWLNRFQK